MTVDKTALVGDVGRSGVTFALTDRKGVLRPETIRTYEAARHTTISAALMAFKDDSGLTSLPRRCGLAVAGVPRGDTISVTSSRWFISKAGLATILQRQPLVLNDFAAIVWAVGADDAAGIEAAGDKAPGAGPGTFAVVGTGSGLGVAAFVRDEAGGVTAMPTEAGHSELIDPSPELAPIIESIRLVNRYCSAESLLSSNGLATIYNALAEHRSGGGGACSAEDVFAAAALGDKQAEKASALFAKALWRFAGNITLIYGAWDGVFLAGPIVAALRTTLAKPDVRQSFVVAGPYANLLRTVPAGFLLIDNVVLHGTAEAVRHQS
jgi:glucokinase